MKKALILSSIVILATSLVACGSKKDQLNGTWKKAKGESSVCRDSFTFSEKNTFEIKNSRLQGGERSSGTYKLVEDNKYQFDYGMGYDTFNIDVKGNTMKVSISGDDLVCKYKKAKED
jgi:hypothetical protein